MPVHKYTHTTYSHITLGNPVHCISFICQIAPPGLLSPSTLFTCLKSLRGNQPQRHTLRAQCLNGAAEASAAFGVSESESLYRSPMGGEESSYSNSVGNASTHRGTVTHSWDNKYHGESYDLPANWDQSKDFFPFTVATKLNHPKKPMNVCPCFRRGHLNVWISVPCNTECGVSDPRGNSMGWNSMGLWDALSGKKAWIETLRQIIHTANRRQKAPGLNGLCCNIVSFTTLHTVSFCFH